MPGPANQPPPFAAPVEPALRAKTSPATPNRPATIDHPGHSAPDQWLRLLRGISLNISKVNREGTAAGAGFGGSRGGGLCGPCRRTLVRPAAWQNPFAPQYFFFLLLLPPVSRASSSRHEHLTPRLGQPLFRRQQPPHSIMLLGLVQGIKLEKDAPRQSAADRSLSIPPPWPETG